MSAEALVNVRPRLQNNVPFSNSSPSDETAGNTRDAVVHLPACNLGAHGHFQTVVFPGLYTLVPFAICSICVRLKRCSFVVQTVKY